MTYFRKVQNILPKQMLHQKQWKNIEKLRNLKRKALNKDFRYL